MRNIVDANNSCSNVPNITRCVGRRGAYAHCPVRSTRRRYVMADTYFLTLSQPYIVGPLNVSPAACKPEDCTTMVSELAVPMMRLLKPDESKSIELCIDHYAAGICPSAPFVASATWRVCAATTVLMLANSALAGISALGNGGQCRLEAANKT